MTGISIVIAIVNIGCSSITIILGYEPAGLTVHPPPPPRIIEGGFIFFAWVSSVTKIFF